MLLKLHPYTLSAYSNKFNQTKLAFLYLIQKSKLSKLLNKTLTITNKAIDLYNNTIQTVLDSNFIMYFCESYKVNVHYKIILNQKGQMGIRSSKNKYKQDKMHLIITYQNMVKVVADYPITKQYDLLDVIGTSTYAQVYRGKAIQTGSMRAIKKVDKKSHSSIWKMLISQFDTIKQLEHPNIIKMYQLFEDYTDFYVVSELCKGTSLYETIKQVKYFEQKQACQIFYQILSAVTYLHSCKIMHRDLKPQNMMYDKKSKILKLINFGTALRFDNSQLVNRRCVGTVIIQVNMKSYYVAPEVLNKKYNQKCDMWSLGVILYILVCGKPPFSGNTNEEILKKVAQDEVGFSHEEFKSVSQDLKVLIKKMLTKDVTKRISGKQLMTHKYLKSVLKNQLLPQEVPFMIKCLQNMKKFQVVLNNMFKQAMKTTKIQQGMLIFIVSFIKNTEDDFILWKCFNKLDLDGDGSISLQQLKKGIKQYLRTSEKQASALVNAVFEKVDFNQTKAIDYSEFVVSAVDLQLAVTERNLDVAFDYIDSDGSGALSAKEIRGKLGDNIEQEVYKKLLKQINANLYGQINRKQFKLMMNQLLDQKLS